MIMDSSAVDTGISSSPDIAASSANASSSLHIAIIGAGIAGLAAAIGLRRAGHKVTVQPAVWEASMKSPR